MKVVRAFVTRLRDRFEALLLDLDGTLYRGSVVIPGAPEALSAADSAQSLMYVTNNASRSAAAVAAHLSELGFLAGADQVVTSAQAAAHVLADRLPRGASVLIVGADDLAAEVEHVGLRPIRRFDDDVPAAVVQGYSPQIAWPDLAEAAYAVRAGALWVAANTDATLPTERGLAPGNGAMVAALRTATDAEPVVAGKPYTPLVEDALTRAGTRSALMVGDRLDTDIDGALSVKLESLLVLTGVSTLTDLGARSADRLPAYVADSLDALNHPVVQDDPVRHSDGDLTDQLSKRLQRYPGKAIPIIG